MRQVGCVLAVTGFATLGLPHAAWSADDNSTVVTQFERVELAAPSAAKTHGFRLRAFGRSFRLRLTPNDALLRNLDPGERKRIRAGGNRFYRGTLGDVEGSWARLSWVGQQWSGGFSDGNELFLIAAELPGQPSAKAQPDADATLASYIYRLSDLQLPPMRDLVADPGTSNGKLDYKDLSRDINKGVKGTSQLREIEITVVTDPAFANDHDGVPGPTVASRLNFADGIYREQVGLALTLARHEPLDSNGTLTSTDASQLLDQFDRFMRLGEGEDIAVHDVAHLFTGRDLDDNVVGVAYSSRVCGVGSGDAIDQNVNDDTTSALVFAHELGHNLGAPHDGEDACADATFHGIMNASINGSEQFSQCSIDEMQALIESVDCLDAVPPPPVFADGFENRP